VVEAVESHEHVSENVVLKLTVNEIRDAILIVS
jgi:hypothetical protein